MVILILSCTHECHVKQIDKKNFEQTLKSKRYSVMKIPYREKPMISTTGMLII